MDALSIRRRGKRAAPKSARGAPFNIGASIGLASTGRPGEFKLAGDQMSALEALYTSSPAITAARSVLRGQLFGGGIVLRRGGKDVTLKPEFQRYLSSKWLAFAGDVLDSFLKWGLCVVAFDEDPVLKRRASKLPLVKGEKREPVLAPIVPPHECIEIAYRQGGRMGYTREYVCYNMTAPQYATKVDEDARVYVREQPDSIGNVISPMSKVFELGSFVTALTELALTAEITNARPRMWTQQRKKEHGQGVETNQLFFDSESRAVQSDLDTQGNAEAAKQLAMQSQLVGLINKLQQRKEDDNGFDHVRNSFTGRGVAAGKHTHVRRTCMHCKPAPPARLTAMHCILRFLLKSHPLYFRCPRCAALLYVPDAPPTAKRSLAPHRTKSSRRRRGSCRRRGATSSSSSASASSCLARRSACLPICSSQVALPASQPHNCRYLIAQWRRWPRASTKSFRTRMRSSTRTTRATCSSSSLPRRLRPRRR